MSDPFETFNIIVDTATATALRFVLEQAAQDRAAQIEQAKRFPFPDGAKAPEPPPVPTFAEALTQAARIGVRALAQGAMLRHERDDVPALALGNGFGHIGAYDGLGERPHAARLAPGAPLAAE